VHHAAEVILAAVFRGKGRVLNDKTSLPGLISWLFLTLPPATLALRGSDQGPARPLDPKIQKTGDII